MSSIVAIVLEALKSNDSIISAESQMMTELSQLVCAGVAQACEQLDDNLCLGHKDYRIIHKDQRHITAMFGDVVFKRRLVKDDSGRLFYPFDEKVGLATGRRFTPMIMAKVAELASLTVMRTTAKAVDLLTPFSMSAMTVDNLVREAGQELDTVREAEAKYITVEVDRRAVPQLFIEGAAFEVKLKHGTQVMVHRVQISEGVTQSGKRHQLINRHSITGLSHEKVFDEARSYIDQHYDLRETCVLTGSDNGSGYSPKAFKELVPGAARWAHVLDGYHLNRKLKERFSMMPRDLQDLLRKSVWTGNKARTEMVLDTAESMVQDTDSGDSMRSEWLDNLTKLRRYLDRNWPYIEALSNRQLDRRGLGSCESNHRRYTYRTKLQGRSWTRSGLIAELRIIDALQNDDYLSSLEATAFLETQIKPEVKTTLRSLQLFGPAPTTHQGAYQGRIALYASTSSGTGHLAHIFN